MKCPNCGLENPDTALRCDCGYDFASGQMKTSALGKEGQVEAALASSGRRFFNFVADIILSRILIVLLLTSFADTEFVEALARNGAADWLFTLFLIFLYYFLFETTLQRTPAKLLTGTKVVMRDGTKPDAGTIAVRTLSRFVPFEPFSGSGDTWWHDRWTKTRVVRS